MKKHIKTSSDVDYLTHKDLSNSKIIHIKTTPSLNGKTHFYWNKSRAELIIGSKVHFPVPSIAHIERYKKSFFDLSRKEIQIGDSIVWFFGRSIQPVVGATVIGVRKEKGKRYLRLLPNHPNSVVPETWALYDPSNFFFVSNNRTDRYRAPANIIYAAYQDELNKIEEIYAPIRTRRLILRYLTNPHLNVGEKAFKECHSELFKGIYSWAGQYRTIELVIGDRQFPTMHPSKVESAMREFCRDFSQRYLRLINDDRERMLNALVYAHKELAWIHPFEDGNGRTIRLYLELIAKTRGYGFDLTASMSSKKKKRYYHFAVRKAVEGFPKILTALLNKVLLK
ncbi:Probable adenosine monophosphate-protein transferase fic [Serratia marcescens]|uniref:Fic family protein n=1 Tax=Serratia marcescens TaxID=615 RepID=UPI00217C8B7B|nr:Fic family protein [Serratia marcescens]CAI0909757.1 Probable adenosine monophosphate-protein transferase fic [Serratia marcescens]CAI0954422.1 Probable adenosine monophosphate-protein transferase fic [Serratia marcescens]